MDQAPWMEHAWAEVGQRELAGPASNPRIAAYYRHAGHGEVASDEVPWCAAFVGACLARAGLEPSRSLMARSYLDWAAALAGPRLGAVVVLSRGGDASQGHVGFLVGWTSSEVYLLGGNQSDAVNVAAFPVSRLIGYRWPEATAPAAPLDPRPASGTFGTALAHVLEMEGGFTDDPYDPGGPTNRGITLAVYGDHCGLELGPATVGEARERLRRLSDDEVREIYLQRYWLPSHAPELPPAIAFMHFDAAVNHGVTGAARLLQEAVGVAIDGEIGPRTLRAVATAPVRVSLAAYADARRRRYRSLPHFWRFGRGWLARVERTLARAQALAPSPLEPTPSNQKGSSMPQDQGAPASPQTPETKWWGHSLTIWGAIITAFSTVLPALGPLVGLDVTADLVRQLGDQVVRVVEAAGGLVGILLTIYGRTRATSRIERRPMRLHL